MRCAGETAGAPSSRALDKQGRGSMRDDLRPRNIRIREQQDQAREAPRHLLRDQLKRLIEAPFPDPFEWPDRHGNALPVPHAEQEIEGVALQLSEPVKVLDLGRLCLDLQNIGICDQLVVAGRLQS